MRKKIEKPILVALGDVHGDWRCIVNFCEKYENTCIVQVGDFGVGFHHPLKEESKFRKLVDILKVSNNELIAIRGNHDNPSYFQDRKYGENVILASDYSVIEHKDRKIQLIGGGISIDRTNRIPTKDWWVGEEVVFKLDFVETVDILLTHVAPTDMKVKKADFNGTVQKFHGVESMIGGNLYEDLSREAELVQLLSDRSNCKYHVFGHYHHPMVEITPNREYRCLTIDEFREI